MKNCLEIETCRPSWTTVGKWNINKDTIVIISSNTTTVYSLITCHVFYILGHSRNTLGVVRLLLLHVTGEGEKVRRAERACPWLDGEERLSMLGAESGPAWPLPRALPPDQPPSQTCV